MRASWIRRGCAAVAVTLVLGACGGSGNPSTPPVGSEVSFNVPVGPGDPATIRLRGTERGTGDVGVVLAHMLGSSESAWITLVTKLVDKGLHTLTFDFRGHGLSGGERNPSRADLDLAGAVAKLRTLGATKIFVIGASLGGTAAIKLAASEDFRGVVSISAPVSIDQLDASQAVGKLDEPSLFIVGQGDNKRYTDAARTLYDNAPKPKRLEVISGTGAHGTDLLLDPKSAKRVEELILDFIETHGGT